MPCPHDNASAHVQGRALVWDCDDCGQDATLAMERESGSFGSTSWTTWAMYADPSEARHPLLVPAADRHGLWYWATHR